MEAPPAAARQRARRRAGYWLTAAAGLMLAAFVILRRSTESKPATPTFDPLAFVPAGPAFVLTADFSRLRASSIGTRLLGKALSELHQDGCKTALGNEVDRVAVTVPFVHAPNSTTAGFDAGSFAVIATGRFRAATVIQCAEDGMRAKHGEPVRTTIGALSSVRDRKQNGEVAARDGVLVMSDGTYFRDVVDAVNGANGANGANRQSDPTNGANRQSDPTNTADGDEQGRDRLHAELRRLVGKNAPIVATLVLREGWLASALGDPEAEKSPLAAIRTAALRADVTSDLDVSALVACDKEDAYVRLERFLGELRSDLGVIAPPGVAALLAKLTVTRDQARIEFSGHLTVDQLEQLTMNAVESPAGSAPAPVASVKSHVGSATPAASVANP